jgi:hypothetical protein
MHVMAADSTTRSRTVGAVIVCALIVSIATFPDAVDFGPAIAVFAPAIVIPIVLGSALCRTPAWWFPGAVVLMLAVLGMVAVPVATTGVPASRVTTPPRSS